MVRLSESEVSFRQMRRYLTSSYQLKLYFQQRHSALLPTNCSKRFLLQLLAGEKLILPRPSTLPDEKQILAMWSGSKKLLIKAIKTVPELVASLPEELEKERLVDLCRAVYVAQPHLFEIASQRYNLGLKQRKHSKVRSVRKELANLLLLLPAVYTGEKDFLASDSAAKVNSTQLE